MGAPPLHAEGTKLKEDDEAIAGVSRRDMYAVKKEAAKMEWRDFWSSRNSPSKKEIQKIPKKVGHADVVTTKTCWHTVRLTRGGKISFF